MDQADAQAHKRLAKDMSNWNFGSSTRDNPRPYRFTNSYRSRAERNDDSLGSDNQGMGDAPETENPSKRVKFDGDSYRPTLQLRPSPTDQRTAEAPAAFRENLAAPVLGFLPPPATPRPSKPSKRERKQKRLATIHRNIQRVQKQLAGLCSYQDLRLEMERLLASYHADLKTWNDRNSKNYPQQWYNTIRLNERNHAQKLLNRAKSTHFVRQQDVKRHWSRLQDAVATVSDDEEEGGVLLTEASVDENRDIPTMEKNLQVHSTKSSHGRRTYRQNFDNLPDLAYLRLRQSELEKSLAEAKQEVHIAEVDINYCHFAPLDKPYVCLFQTDDHGRIIGSTRRVRKMIGRSDADSELELQKDTRAGILRTNIGDKPPLWLEIEEKMDAGSFKGLADSLGLGIDEHHLTEVGGKVDALERSLVGTTLKRRYSWMDDEIAPEDLDSESESDSDDDHGGNFGDDDDNQI